MQPPGSFGRRRRRAWADTKWFSWKFDIVPVIASAAGGVWGAWKVRDASFELNEVFIPALCGLGAIGAWIAISNGTEFLWNYSVAGYRNAIDDLHADSGSPRSASDGISIKQLTDYVNDQLAPLNTELQKLSHRPELVQSVDFSLLPYAEVSVGVSGTESQIRISNVLTAVHYMPPLGSHIRLTVDGTESTNISTSITSTGSFNDTTGSEMFWIHGTFVLKCELLDLDGEVLAMHEKYITVPWS